MTAKGKPDGREKPHIVPPKHPFRYRNNTLTKFTRKKLAERKLTKHTDEEKE